MVPVEDMAELGAVSEPPQRQPIQLGPAGIGTSPSQGSIWPSIHPRAARADPRAPFDDRVRERPPAGRATGRPAERARRRGPRARPPRLDRARAAPRDRGRPEGRHAARDRRDARPSSSGSTWARSTSSSRWSRRARSRAGSSGSAARATRWASRAAARSSRSSAATCSRRRWSPSGCSPARSRRRATRGTRSTCSRSRSSRCARSTSGASTTSRPRPTCGELRGALATTCSCAVLDLLAGRYPCDEFAELRPRIVWDRAGGHGSRARGRRPARDHLGRHDPRPRPVRRVPARRRRVGELDEEMVYESRDAARSSCSARRPGGSRTSRSTA